MEHTQILKQCLDNDLLIKINDSLKTLPKDKAVHTPQGNYYPIDSTISQLIIDRLPLHPNEKCFVNILKHETVLSLHTDTNVAEDSTTTEEDIKKFCRTFIIPVVTQDTHTIVFHQHLQPGQRGSELFDYIDRLPTINMLSEHSDYFSHEDKQQDWFTKLSIETVFPWVAGDVLCFDRTKAHCGDNHIGKVKKYGIVIWTELVTPEEKQ